MTTADLIDRTIKYVDGLDPTVGNHVVRRARYLQVAQQGVIEMSNTRAGLFWTKDTLLKTILATTSSVSLGNTFKEISRDGKVYVTALGDSGEMEWAPPHEIQRLQMKGDSTAHPEVYSIFGHDSLGAPLLQTQKVSADTPLSIYCRLRAPVLVDSADATASLLQMIPDEWVYTVLLPYMRWMGFDDNGDDRADKWERRYREGLAVMSKIDGGGGGRETASSVPGYGLEGHC